jgi:hypothetical protein
MNKLSKLQRESVRRRSEFHVDGKNCDKQVNYAHKRKLCSKQIGNPKKLHITGHIKTIKGIKGWK